MLPFPSGDGFEAENCINFRVIVKQETKQKRNETKQAETKRSETRHNRNETKPNKSSMNIKNEANINETIFIYMRQQSTKCQWRIEKPLKFTEKIWLWKKKIIRISYQKAHHIPASCVLCKFLRFIEKKKYI